MKYVLHHGNYSKTVPNQISAMRQIRLFQRIIWVRGADFFSFRTATPGAGNTFLEDIRMNPNDQRAVTDIDGFRYVPRTSWVEDEKGRIVDPRLWTSEISKLPVPTWEWKPYLWSKLREKRDRWPAVRYSFVFRKGPVENIHHYHNFRRKRYFRHTSNLIKEIYTTQHLLEESSECAARVRHPRRLIDWSEYGDNDNRWAQKSWKERKVPAQWAKHKPRHGETVPLSFWRRKDMLTVENLHDILEALYEKVREIEYQYECDNQWQTYHDETERVQILIQKVEAELKEASYGNSI